MVIDTVLRYAVAVLIFALISSNTGWLVHSRGLASERDAAIAARATLAADVAAARAEFEAKARKQEREQRDALAGVRVIFDREMTDAQTKHDAVVADLRAGTLRLRRHWEARVATAELSAAAAAGARAGEADADAELRGRDSADLVRLGAECDSQIRGLQSAVRAYAGGTP